MCVSLKLHVRFLRLVALCATLVSAISIAGVIPAHAQSTVSVGVMKDATLRGGAYANTRHGSDALLVTRASDYATYVRRAALTFDTESTVPDNATIQSATLVLTVRGGNAETRQLAAYGMPISFEEPYVTWNARNSGALWTHPGGDTTGTGPRAYVTSTVGSQVSFDVTSHVQAVINGQYGSRYSRFLVQDLGGSSRDSYKEYHSRESTDAARRPKLIVTYGSASTTTSSPTVSPTAPTATGDIVLGPEHVSSRAGRWVVESNSGALNGKVVRHPDAGLAKLETALAAPANYFEMQFQAQAGTAYRLWIHGRADRDHWSNDSVHVQFSGSVTSTGSATYRIGTTSAAWVNLEECANCGLTGWQWQDNGYGSGVLGSKIYFAASGTQTIRIQTREDGLAIDRVLLSPATYMSAPPGGTAPAPAPAPEPAPAPAPAPAPEPAPSGTTTIRVLHWNIHHGVGTDGKYDIQRFVTWMAKWRPDLISINETEKYTEWGYENQPERFKVLLQQATGQTWYYHFTQEWGAFNSNGKGNLIMSRFPFVATAREGLVYNRSVGIGTVVINGRNVTFMSTHLDPNSRDVRYAQTQQLLKIASTWPEPRMIIGDLNAWPDQASILLMNPANYDSWAEAEKMGTAKAAPDIDPYGATRNGRIDYIFHSKGSATVLRLISVQVPDTRDANGYMPSDHRPVLTTYEVR